QAVPVRNLHTESDILDVQERLILTIRLKARQEIVNGRLSGGVHVPWAISRTVCVQQNGLNVRPGIARGHPLKFFDSGVHGDGDVRVALIRDKAIDVRFGTVSSTGPIEREAAGSLSDDPC